MAEPHHLAHWYPTAAYLYVLCLDTLALAWEYLRRNIAYQRLWRHRYRLAADAVAPWHLAQLEDPGLDARQAHPVWQYPLADQVALHGMRPTPGLALPVFSLWALRGRKQVRALSGGYALQVRQASHTLRAVCDVRAMEGAAADLVIPLNRYGSKRLRALQAQWRSAPSERLFRDEAHRLDGQTYRASRAGQLHLHALMALDALQANASHRDIAVALVGEARTREQWHADATLRGLVRHYLRRGRYFRDGGYRSLLTASRAG